MTSARLTGELESARSVLICSIEETLLPWLAKTLETFVPYLPGPSTPPLGSTELPPPIYRLEPVDEAAVSLDSLSLDDENGEVYADVPEEYRSQSKAARAARARVYHPPGWGWATLSKNQRVTSKDWFQDVREIELELEPGV